MIEIMLYELSSEIIPEEYTYIIGRGIIDKGAFRTLKDDLNIKVGDEQNCLFLILLRNKYLESWQNESDFAVFSCSDKSTFY